MWPKLYRQASIRPNRLFSRQEYKKDQPTSRAAGWPCTIRYLTRHSAKIDNLPTQSTSSVPIHPWLHLLGLFLWRRSSAPFLASGGVWPGASLSLVQLLACAYPSQFEVPRTLDCCKAQFWNDLAEKKSTKTCLVMLPLTSSSVLVSLVLAAEVLCSSQYFVDCTSTPPRLPFSSTILSISHSSSGARRSFSLACPRRRSRSFRSFQPTLLALSRLIIIIPLSISK